MDMESCGQIRTEGLYFNQDTVLVVYNRWTQRKNEFK
jgi:hypothetical protein